MEIKLKRLILSNFKGLTGEFEFNNERNVFLGANGTGKTTLADSVSWGLFGKDSQDSAKFDIKTIVDGEPLHQIDHSVLQEWEIDGEPLTLERVYSEKWTKTRGQLNPEFSGHQTDYRINGDAKTTKRNYDDVVSKYFGSDKFKLCSDIRHFPSLKWEERRKLLIEMSGVKNDGSLIDNVSGFHEMLYERDPKTGMINTESTPEQARKRADERRKKINEEMKTLPARIDEQNKIMSETKGSNISKDQAWKNVAKAQVELNAAQKAVDDFKAGNSLTEKLQDLNKKAVEAETKFNDEKNSALRIWNDKNNRIETIQDLISGYKTKLKSKEQIRLQLLDQWNNLKSSEFDKSSTKCPISGEWCETAENEGEAGFNRQRSNGLEENKTTGLKLKDEIVKIKEAIEKNEKELTSLNKTERPTILDQTENDDIRMIKAQIVELQNSDFSKPVPEDLLIKLGYCQEELKRAQEVEAAAKATESNQKRVDELREKMAQYSAENDKIEKFIHLHDQYNKLLAEQTEKPVNEMFDYIKFRMFTTQVNGAIVPCCDMMDKDGKPYETALSYGERLRAGIDFIKTSQKFYQMDVPVFIDNAESLTIPIDLDCQVIEMRASTEHKQLTKGV